MKKKIMLVCVSFIMGISLVGCTTGQNTEDSGNSDNGNNEQAVTLMEANEVASMNTLVTQDTASINAQVHVFEGLYSIDQENEVVPAVATDMPEISEDGKTYTIQLRDDANWSNGDPVTADDFVYAWRRLASPENEANYMFLLDGTIENGSEIINDGMDPEELGVKAVNDKELEIQLEKPVPYFTSLMTFPPFFPQNEEFVEEQGKEYGNDSEKILSNGAFTMENWDQSSMEWDLTKNPEYYDADKVKLEDVHVDVIKEAVTAFNLFQSGELDQAEIFGEYVKQNEDNPNLQKVPDSKVFYFKMNQKSNDEDTIFANSDVRKAVAYAIDKESIVENVLADGSSASYGYIPEGFVKNPETDADFREDAGDLMETNEEKAKEHWEKAKEEIGDEITIELLTSDEDDEKKVAETVQYQLQEALPGLKLEVKSVPLNNSIELTRNSEYELAIGRWGPDYQDPMTYLESLRSPNNTNYESDTYDDLLDQISNDYGNDPEKRWQAMIKVEKTLVEDDTAIVPLYQQTRSLLVRDNLQGIYYPSFGASTIFKYATSD
ncbi:peptide ABC transporter substrate-binding protein [Tetragenococcus koreensis]|uniref:Oligopeptide ABC transporter substrate-binding protein n=1 Tax=Tetragenococcus koreensis TaxID=290335 RepID=A0AAN4ZPP2_9ENTE|nr:peptide ABC transporter substrate-binding protein [Tetragenococcus koreensis]MCF1619650.1 peptide ABC transporter substrate-binding protein [Tetragenococcus koreensis]MCF1657133.1 peptide ABC transporter substrate-binding protein [Tetragenococcus koreensis]GEQ49610.1 oligopeptide ABC transporter substrate-binding protein [Tetragenococcus koreensis]GEQ52056.1 oligopeptide ABC transporter substrate-binding protein [Tetragenococcus koreensis]GEQ54591.1 oligopeptide ABC transporter substrate-bi